MLLSAVLSYNVSAKAEICRQEETAKPINIIYFIFNELHVAESRQ